MNKKELAAFKDVERQLREARALRFTEPVAPDMPIPTHEQGTVQGYSFHAAGGHYARVQFACSSSIYHSTSDRPVTETRSQRPIQMYSTKLLALRALRAELERICAAELGAIDLQIEAEIKAHE